MSEAKRKLREDKQRLAVKLATDGLSPTEIACRLRVGSTSIANWLKAAGVEYRRSNRGSMALLPFGTP